MSELNLPFVRFVKQVSNGMARTKYSYLAMQTDLLADLQRASWRLATCPNNTVTTVPNKVAQTDAVVDEQGVQTSPPTYTAYINDRYDAYKQGGDANISTATFCGYAGMAAYRFKLPDGYAANITSVKLKFQAARYLRSGLKVTVVLSDADEPSDDWAVIRGTATSTASQKIVSSPSETATDVVGVSSWGFLSQDVPTLIDTRASEATLDMDASQSRYADLGTTTRYTYLWVYVGIEDYQDYWAWYNATEPRYYSIEGSATLVGSACSVTFADEVAPDEPQTFVYQECTSFYSHDLVGSDSPEGTAELWGNFAQFKNVSALYLPAISNWQHDPRPSIAALSRFAVFPRKPLFLLAQWWENATKVRATEAIPKEDIGVFACIPQAYMWEAVNNAYANIPPLHRGYQYRRCGMSFSVGYSDYGRAGVNASGQVAVPSKLTIETAVLIVPPNNQNYNRIVLYLESPYAISVNMTGGVNVWRCASPDAMGMYGQAALGVLQSHQELFVRGVASVSASLAGTGTFTQGVTIKASADYVGYAKVVAGARSVAIELTQPVQPGDLLLLAPCLERLDAQPYDSSKTIDQQPWPKLGFIMAEARFS